LEPERRGSPLVQEKCWGEKACDKRHPYRIIMMMMMMMMMIIIIIISEERLKELFQSSC
jgi:hypothetical protein